jgi:hypothetical protein
MPAESVAGIDNLRFHLPVPARCPEVLDRRKGVASSCNRAVFRLSNFHSILNM